MELRNKKAGEMCYEGNDIHSTVANSKELVLYMKHVLQPKCTQELEDAHTVTGDGLCMLQFLREMPEDSRCGIFSSLAFFSLQP